MGIVVGLFVMAGCSGSSNPESVTSPASQPTAKAAEPAKQVKLEFMSNMGAQTLKEV